MAPIVGFCVCSMFCFVLLCVLSSFAIILMGKRELVALLCLSSWSLVIVMWLFLAVPWVGLLYLIVVFPDYTHLLFMPFLKSRVFLKVCHATLTLQRAEWLELGIFINTVQYVRIQPKSKTLLMFGDDSFTILKIKIFGVYFPTRIISGHHLLTNEPRSF